MSISKLSYKIWMNWVCLHGNLQQIDRTNTLSADQFHRNVNLCQQSHFRRRRRGINVQVKFLLCLIITVLLGVWRCRSTHFSRWYDRQFSDQLHAATTVTPWKDLPEPTTWETWWASGAVRTTLWRENLSTLTGIEEWLLGRAVPSLFLLYWVSCHSLKLVEPKPSWKAGQESTCMFVTAGFVTVLRRIRYGSLSRARWFNDCVEYLIYCRSNHLWARIKEGFVYCFLCNDTLYCSGGYRRYSSRP